MINYEFNKHIFPYKWNLIDGYPAKGIESNGLKVFGTFICGGGSTMGYKLAGFNHLGGVEIDPLIADVYKANHNPKYLFNQDIREFNKLNDLPEELYNLDLLDGSPPCSSFSMSGSREKAWGKEKQFKEGQAFQTLDDLVFEYCNTITKLQPKVFLLENVKGIIMGNAKAYSRKIVQTMELAGYKVQVFLLNAASMGVPQKRERVFFIGHKKELKLNPLKLNFNETPITYKNIKLNQLGAELTFETRKVWEQRQTNDTSLSDIHLRISGKAKRFNAVFIKDDKVPNTLAAGSDSIPIRYDIPNRVTMDECKLIGSYPLDYNFKKLAANYIIGMSVPPIMTPQIANQIYLQWLTD